MTEQNTLADFLETAELAGVEFTAGIEDSLLITDKMPWTYILSKGCLITLSLLCLTAPVEDKFRGKIANKNERKFSFLVHILDKDSLEKDSLHLKKLRFKELL